jgi:hypothetical protein
MLHSIAGKNNDIGLLRIDIRYAAPQTISPQSCCGLIRCGQQYVRIADLCD